MRRGRRILLLLLMVVVVVLLLLPLFSVLQAGWQIYVFPAGWQISDLQAGWEIPFSAEVVRAVVLVCRLLSVTTFSGLSPASVVTSFVLLVVSQHMFHLFIQWYSLPLVFFFCWHTNAGKLFLVPQQLVMHISHLQQLVLILLFIPHIYMVNVGSSVLQPVFHLFIQ